MLTAARFVIKPGSHIRRPTCNREAAGMQVVITFDGSCCRWRTFSFARRSSIGGFVAEHRRHMRTRAQFNKTFTRVIYKRSIILCSVSRRNFILWKTEFIIHPYLKVLVVSASVCLAALSVRSLSKIPVICCNLGLESNSKKSFFYPKNKKDRTKLIDKTKRSYTINIVINKSILIC